ncbi:MAG: RelA/SpoT family protein [Patescibacteria group bacterium]|nr:RelA/SpoT family protein [Patescibacteria group bacterium]
MTINDLLKIAKENNPKADLDSIRLAFDFAEQAHHGQTRLSGEPYIEHSLETAKTLAEMKLNVPIIQAGLLHDVPEDTDTTLEEIEKNFGADVAQMVMGITKLGKIKYRGMDRYIENLRKMFIAMASDVRVIFIKFADRIHNLRTLDVHSPKKRYRIALESLEIYAPIANRLGMGEIKGTLEDLSFKYVYPKEYQWTIGLMTERREVKEKSLKDIIKKARHEIEQSGFNIIDIHGRAKHIYSLYKKLLRYDRDINMIHDLVAVRIIVEDIADCYGVLGIIHSKWPPMKARIKDYIAQPKPNGYKSLHTTVFCDNGEIVEFQIRTEGMHDEAELGIAAHWNYEESIKSKRRSEKQIQWVNELAQIQEQLQSRTQYLRNLEDLKIDVFQTHIFVITPKGDVIDLPEDSTPVDFAYAIHSEIGDKCVGVKINGEMTNLDTRLKSGDLVEIIIDKKRKGPNPDWLKFAKTSSAKAKIRTKTKIKITDWLKSVIPPMKK